jgi:hypothetical protein
VKKLFFKKWVKKPENGLFLQTRYAGELVNKKIEDILVDLLKSYGKRVKRPNKKFALHVPHRGSSYDKTKFLVIGRALNGANQSLSENYMVKNAHSIVSSRFRTASLDWLESFNRSPFFNVTKDVVTLKYNLDEKDWYEHFTWSNLMKISPAMKGNPTDREFSLQLEYCKKLFKLELDTLQPKNVLMLTDFEWAYDFIEGLGLDPDDTPISSRRKYIRGKYKYRKTNIIVFKRPERETRSLFVQAILKEIK